jgi:hypothetical protein
MTDSHFDPASHPHSLPRPGGGPASAVRAAAATRSASAGRSVAAVPHALHDLVRSTDPVAVFASLATISVPLFSDACEITLVEGSGPHHHLVYPIAEESNHPACSLVTSRPAQHELNTPISSPFGEPVPYRGLITHRWHGYVPTQADAAVAQLMSDAAVATIRAERMAERIVAALDKVAELERVVRGAAAPEWPR